MKKVIALLLALLLVLASITSVYANSSIYDSGILVSELSDMMKNDTADKLANHMNRDADPPNEGFSLYGQSYTGIGWFYTKVYSGKYFTNHGGSITIYLDTICQVPIQDAYITVKLCHPGLFDTDVIDEIRNAPAYGETCFTFTGLNSNRNYYFLFQSSHSPYQVTIDFEVYGAYSN